MLTLIVNINIHYTLQVYYTSELLQRKALYKYLLLLLYLFAHV